jgi:hypothetical protein
MASLTISQNPKGLNIDILGKKIQPEYMGINMICMPQVDSNISDSAKFGGVVSQVFVEQMSSL